MPQLKKIWISSADINAQHRIMTIKKRPIEIWENWKKCNRIMTTNDISTSLPHVHFISSDQLSIISDKVCLRFFSCFFPSTVYSFLKKGRHVLYYLLLIDSLFIHTYTVLYCNTVWSSKMDPCMINFPLF